MSIDKKEYKKIYIKLSDKIVDQLDNVSNSLGVARSNLIAYYIGQGLKKEIADNPDIIK